MSSGSSIQRNVLITTSIRRPIFPPLQHLCTIKRLLPKPLIHLIMPLTHPPTESCAPTDIRLRFLDTLRKVFAAVTARIEIRNSGNEGTHRVLLGGGGVDGVVGGCCVEECPCCATEGLYVGWTVGWTLRECFLRSLRGRLLFLLRRRGFGSGGA
jgi:hypothetical protein